MREIFQYFISSQVWFCQTGGQFYAPRQPVFISTTRTTRTTSNTTSNTSHLTRLARVMGRPTIILTWETVGLTSPALTRTWAPASVVGSSPPSLSPSSSSPSPSPCLSASRWSRSTREPSSSDWADFSMEARRVLVSSKLGLPCSVCLLVVVFVWIVGWMVGSC